MCAAITRYDVFLSHNSADKPAVQVLVDLLRAAGIAPFLDIWHLIPGTPWQEGIEEALEASATVAVFVGPSGISPWHNEEMRDALDRAVRSRDDYRVIPVLLPGADEGSVSRFLARRVWVDFRSGLDDKAALQRLVAGVKGEAVEVGTYQLPDEPAPYRGLLPFEAEHARFFFGRDDDVRRLVEKLGQHRFTVVVGASGSGKSSLVMAGLFPKLTKNALPDSARWKVLRMTPGSDPLRSLANQLATLAPPNADRLQAADALVERLGAQQDGLRSATAAYLAGKPQRLLLFVDQFEELFTQCQEGPDRCRAQAEQFVANLADAVEQEGGHIRVLITLRADFLDRCLALPALRKLLEDRQVLLGPMDEPALREAIVRPASEVGALFEKGLVSMILRDVGDEPGRLPLLEHALHELWLVRRGPWLTLEAYEGSGGVQGALNRRAQAIYDAFNAEQQRIARNILLRLTALGEGVAYARRRALRDELYTVGVAREQVDAVLQALAGSEARLLVVDGESVQVTHEALIRQWSTLLGWLEEDLENLRLHRELTWSAQEWDRLGRDVSALYRGIRLDRALEWYDAMAGNLNPVEQAFLVASRTERDRERIDAAKQRQRELDNALQLAQEANARRIAEEHRAAEQTIAASRLRRRAFLLTILGVLAVILAIASTWLATRESQARNDADRSRSTAIAEATKARDAEATAVSESHRAMEAEAGAKNERRQAERQQIISESRALAAQAALAAQSDPQLAILLGIESAIRTQPDLPVSGETTELLYSELAKVRWKETLRTGHEGNVNSAAWNRDNSQILTASSDGTAKVWDSQSGIELMTLDGHANGVRRAEWSPEGSQILTAGLDGRIILWNAQTGQQNQVFQTAGASYNHATWSPVDDHILAANIDGSITVWDITDETEPYSAQAHSDWLATIAWHPDGTRFLTVGGELDRSLKVWSGVSGKVMYTLSCDSAVLYHAAWSHDGTRIVASGQECAKVWDAVTGQEMVVLRHPTWIRRATWSRDDAMIATVGDDSIVRIWDSKTGEEIWALTGHSSLISSANWNSEGTQLVTASYDGTAILWNVLSGVPINVFLGHSAEINSAVWDHQEKNILTFATDGNVRVWEATTGRFLFQLGGHFGPVWFNVWNSDSTRLLTGGYDWTARIWSTDSQNSLRLLGHQGPVTDAAWNAVDGSVVTASIDGSARVWNSNTGQQILELEGHEAPVFSVAWSPDWKSIVTAGADETARVWDAATGLQRFMLSGHNDWVTCAVWSPDGSRILTCSSDKTARIWNPFSEELLRTLRDNSGEVIHGSWSLDGTRVLTSHSDGVARVWDAESGNLLWRLENSSSPLTYAEWNHRGDQIITAGQDGTSKLWNAITGSERLQLAGQSYSIWHMAWSHMDDRILTTSDDGTTSVWDADTGQQVVAYPNVSGPVLSATWSSDDSLVVTTTASGGVHFWDASRLHNNLVLNPGVGRAMHVSWNHAGDQIAGAFENGEVLIWRAETGQEIHRLSGHQSAVRYVAWSHDDRYILTASSDHSAKIWNAVTGVEIRSLKGNQGYVDFADWSPEDKLIVTTSWDGTARVWESSTGRERFSVPGYQGLGAVWSSDGKQILVTDWTNAGVWNVTAGRQLLTLSGHTEGVYHAAWDSDDARIATASADRTARVWNATTGEELVVLTGHQHMVRHLAWNPDGGQIATASFDATARVWDAATGQELHSLLGHEDTVVEVDWSPDGERLLTASWDHTVRLWDAATGRELVVLSGHEGSIAHAEWSPDGKQVATASDDGSIRIWFVELEDLVAYGCDHVDRNLSHDEWKRYIGRNVPYRKTCPDLPVGFGY